MGVYIRGMKMPKTCGGCDLCAIIDIDDDLRTTGCRRLKKVVYDLDKRLPDCPLKEVETHGRLIDADALIDYCKHFAEVFKNSSLPIDKARRDELLGVIGEIVNTPTVIEEEVYGQYTDTAGNYHWIGTKSGEHTIKV